MDANEVKSNLLDLTTDEETEITLLQSDVLQFRVYPAAIGQI